MNPRVRVKRVHECQLILLLPAMFGFFIV